MAFAALHQAGLQDAYLLQDMKKLMKSRERIYKCFKHSGHDIENLIRIKTFIGLKLRNSGLKFNSTTSTNLFKFVIPIIIQVVCDLFWKVDHTLGQDEEMRVPLLQQQRERER